MMYKYFKNKCGRTSKSEIDEIKQWFNEWKI